MNAEFQRIAKRVKKTSLSDQCKETEENNRMGKTRDLFKKMRDTKRTFHAKMSIIKCRNGLGLIEAKEIKKRHQEYQKNCTKHLLMTGYPLWYGHSPRARHPKVRSQVGLRKHYYE